MNLPNFILNRYNSTEMIRKGYYLRIRGAGEKIEIKVYYMGIQMMQYKDGELTVNPAVFVPNSKNVFKKKPRSYISLYDKMPTYVEADVKLIEKYFNFQIGEKKKLIKFDLAQRALDLPDADKEILLEKIRACFKGKEIKMNDEKTKFTLRVNKTELPFKELYNFIIELLKVTFAKDAQVFNLKENGGNKKSRFFKTASIYAKCVLNDETKKDIAELTEAKAEEMFEDIESSLARRIKVYIKDKDEKPDKEDTEPLVDGEKAYDYLNTKTDTNQEKQVQQSFMCLFNDASARKDILYKPADGGKESILFSKDCYPFELEYTIYTGTAKKENNQNIIIIPKDENNDGIIKANGNIKGRIDNVLVDPKQKTIKLVEIKHGTGVIADTNGIHKHLIDIYSCLNLSKNAILEEFVKFIKQRRAALENAGSISPNESGDISIENISYDIVCIYEKNCEEKDASSLSEKAVRDKIDEIYEEKVSKILGKSLNMKKVTDEERDANKYYAKLLDNNVKELIDRIESEKINCPVKIILVDSRFEEFKEYSFNKKVGTL